MLMLLLAFLASGSIADEVAQDVCGAHIVVTGRPQAPSIQDGFAVESLQIDEVFRKLDVQESVDGAPTVLDVASGGTIVLATPQGDARCSSETQCVLFLRKQVGSDRFSPVTSSSSIRIDGDTAIRVNDGVVLGSASELLEHLRHGALDCANDL